MADSKSFQQWRPHPWHGLNPGAGAPSIVEAYIEMSAFEVVKYEVDKESGFLRVDRPQRGTSVPPALYGFIPQTYCAENVQALCDGADKGDGDPLDICVFCERPIDRSDILLEAKVLGGLQMIDDGEADDKIVAVLSNDCTYAEANDISDLPSVFIERLRHYFETYKLVPGKAQRISIDKIYGREHALKVIEASFADYKKHFRG